MTPAEAEARMARRRQVFAHALGKGFFQAGSEGWGPFSFLNRQEERKEKVKLAQLSMQQAAEDRKFEVEERERRIVDDLRQKINAKLAQVEEVASEAVAVMESARKLAQSPRLVGDPVLSEFDRAVSDLEAALVQVQAGTVIDVASTDSHRLAVSYGDAQSAIVAMGGLKNRAIGLRRLLEGRLAELTQQEQAARQQREQEARERQRQEQLEAEARARQEHEAALAQLEAEARARQDYLRAVRELNDQISREAREVRRLKEEIDYELRTKAAG